VLSKVLTLPDCNPVVRYDHSCVDAHHWPHDSGSHDIPGAQH
jgi:hypothetical protein